MQVVTAHGASIPAIGFGTMTLTGGVCVELVSEALRVGYHHLDTAQMYGNEAEVGAGLKASGVARTDVFVTTKIWHTNAAAADFARSVDECLKKLDLSVVDLLLIHWPSKQVPMAETVGALCKAKRDGLTRHVGVANFTIPLLEQALKAASEPLVTNQIEAHPFIDQSKVIAACARLGVSVTAYCPLARGKVPGNPVLERIAKAHGRTAAQVSLRYLVQRGLAVIPRTSNKARLAENLAAADFTLTEAEMAEIATLARPDGRVVSPPHAPQWDAA